MTLEEILLLVKRENDYHEYLAWRTEQEKLYYYYVGDKYRLKDYLKTALEITYKDSDVEEMQLNFVNITKKIVNQQAVIYKHPADRYIVDESGEEDEDMTEYYNDILPDKINSIDKKASRLGKLANTSITEIYFDNGKINYRVDPNFQYRVIVEDEDPKKIKMITYDKEIEDQIYIYVWTNEYHFRINPNGKPEPIPGRGEEDLKNYYGIIPFVFLTFEDGLDIWGDGQTDLVNVNEQINFLLTNLINDQIVMGAGGGMLVSNCDIDKKATSDSIVVDNQVRDIKSIRFNRKHPIITEGVRTDMKDPKIEFIGLDPHITEIQESIDWYIKMIARTKGINPNSFFGEPQSTSGFSKMVDSVEQLEMRMDDMEPCREYEKQRFNVTRIINNYYATTTDGKKYKLKEIPEKLELKIDFAEIEMPQSQDEIWKDRKEKEDRNMGSALDWLIEENPDLDIKEAQRILNENKQRNEANKPKVNSFTNLFNRTDVQKQNSEE